MTRTKTSDAKAVTIGWVRDDGDFQVCATINNLDEYLPDGAFHKIVATVARIFANSAGEQVEVHDREDIVSYLTIPDSKNWIPIEAYKPVSGRE